MSVQEAGSQSINSYKQVGGCDNWDILLVGMQHRSAYAVSFLDWAAYQLESEAEMEQLLFVAEPDNPYGANAIAVYWRHDNEDFHIGYVGRYYQESCRSLMAAYGNGPHVSYEFKKITMNTSKAVPIDAFLNFSFR